MNSQRDSTGSVLVIVAPAFGEKLRAVPTGQPVWIAMSPANVPAVRSLWAGQGAPDHLTGITGSALTKAFQLKTCSLQSWTRSIFIIGDVGLGSLGSQSFRRLVSLFGSVCIAGNESIYTTDDISKASSCRRLRLQRHWLPPVQWTTALSCPTFMMAATQREQ